MIKVVGNGHRQRSPAVVIGQRRLKTLVEGEGEGLIHKI